jgi:transcriptional regulator with XRE-family HTH domain
MKLSEYLAENGISQIFFASKINYCHNYLNMILKGRRKPSKQFIKAVDKYIKSVSKSSKQTIPKIDWKKSEGEDKEHNEQ